MKLRHPQSGFTLVETTIVLALIGLLTFLVVSGSSVATNADRFGSQIRIFTSTIRDAQTKSYTVQTGPCTSNKVLLPGGQYGCVWRGNVMKFQVNASADKNYTLNLLQGDDLSTYAGSIDPKFGLLAENAFKTYNLASLILYGIDLSTAGTTIPVGTVAIAFLAPDGKGYICGNNSPSCAVGGGATPFTDNTSKVTFHFRDTKNPNLKLDVLFDPANGSISTIQP